MHAVFSLLYLFHELLKCHGSWNLPHYTPHETFTHRLVLFLIANLIGKGGGLNICRPVSPVTSAQKGELKKKDIHFLKLNALPLQNKFLKHTYLPPRYVSLFLVQRQLNKQVTKEDMWINPGAKCTVQCLVPSAAFNTPWNLWYTEYANFTHFTTGVFRHILLQACLPGSCSSGLLLLHSAAPLCVNSCFVVVDGER